MLYGDKVKYLYDALDRVEEIRYNNITMYTYTYDAWGNFTTTVTSENTTLENNIVRYYNPLPLVLGLTM